MRVESTRQARVPQRMTRAQRRAAERARAHEVRQQPSRLPLGTVIGGLMTIAALIAIFAYALLRQQPAASSGTAHTAGLTDPQSFNPAPALLRAGSRAPDLTLKDMWGMPYHLAAQRGHPVLLEFYAVWCPVCQGETPTMARLYREFAPRGVRVWAVLANPYGRNYENSGRSDLSPATMFDLAWYGKTFHAQYPQLVDQQFQMVNRYGVNGYPGLYILNPDGTIGSVFEGHQPYSKLATALNKALKARG